MKEMAVRNLVQEHKAVCSSLNSIYEQKNKAYGNSFGDTYKEFGNISALTRMSDKWNRIKNLSLNNIDKMNDESLVDSCMDLANYLIMYVMEIQGDRNETN